MKEFKGLIGDKNIFFHSFKKIFQKNILNTKVILEFSLEVDPFFQLTIKHMVDKEIRF